MEHYSAGPLPDAQTLRKFKNLTHLKIDCDFRPGNLTTDIYELENLVKLSLRGFPSSSLDCIFDCDSPTLAQQAIYKNGLYQLPSGISRLQKLESLRYHGEYSYGDGFIDELFHLPHLRKVEIEDHRFEHTSPNDILKLVHEAEHLHSLTLKNNRGPQWNPLTTWPDFGLLRGTHLKSLQFSEQNLEVKPGSLNSLQNLSLLTNLNEIDMCDNYGLEYPTPDSTLANTLRTKTIVGHASGAEMVACLSKANAERGNFGPKYQEVCRWMKLGGQTSKKGGESCYLRFVYDREGRVKNESASPDAP